MLKILLIRHSMTAGNKLGRYIGARTDEPLCEEGIRLLENFSYPPVQRVFVSPMRRCRETAEILFPGIEKETEERLKECDFGIFENKNYQELSGEPRYQAWIDSNGTLPFPEGESQKMFQKRCVEGFARCVEQCLKEAGVKRESIDLVVPHQASRALDVIMPRLGFRKGTYIDRVSQYGNMISASVPYALCEAMGEGRVEKGDLVLLIGTAAGLTAKFLLMRI